MINLTRTSNGVPALVSEVRRLTARIAELEAENSALSANTCHDGYADDSGNHRCGYQDALCEKSEIIAEQLRLIRDQRERIDAAGAKVWFYQVANHLTDEQRHRLFKQLDRLHDVEEWEEDDQPIRQRSFVTFLRTMMVLRHGRWPNLGLSHQGNLLAVWGDARDRVTLEFLDPDQLKWTLSHVRLDGQIVRNAGIGPALDIRNLLSPYNPSHWFGVT